MENKYQISTEKQLLDVEMIHDFLSTKAYWSLKIPKETVVKAIEHSLCFGVYEGNEQLGFARVISDYSTIAYLGDVFILEAHRGKGLSKLLMEAIMNHDELQGLRRWILLTGDAHGLYKKYGWKEIADSTVWLELHDPGVYKDRV
ncbi:GNAT family N-acetyltransferase [Neolewinella agarilytica]|uniref:Acetyltransferase (GNAT) domain-containing protein n=1 Tax=Neolewinella agarilytica TaxID=478744 RepID=A0A1H9JQ28_9BACT|nr:GNAT family N-acetyltransferase [Neolewinella agarilytica]SEQ88917.1 Acetyltransferase (GNAT) domain-containing protein [Neolewinella agarilytica]